MLGEVLSSSELQAAQWGALGVTQSTHGCKTHIPVDQLLK
jgi:hypothetical protein